MGAIGITASVGSKAAVMASSIGDQLSEKYKDVSLTDIGNYLKETIPSLTTKEGRKDFVNDLKAFCEDNKTIFKEAWGDYKEWASDGVGKGIRYASNPLVAFAVDAYDRYKETGEISLFNSVSAQDVEVTTAQNTAEDVSKTDAEILKSAETTVVDNSVTNEGTSVDEGVDITG